MKFDLSDDQEMLRESLARYLKEQYSFADRRIALTSPLGWRMKCWKGFAQDLGILGAAFAESLGGTGGGPVESMIVMEELGRCLVLEPYLATVVIGGGFLKYGGGPRAAELIGRIIAGDAVIAFAHAEKSLTGEPAAMAARARRTSGGYVLNGAKTLVRVAAAATHFVVTARTAGASGDPLGVSVFIVDPKAPGITVRSYITFDGQRASDIRFDDVTLGADALVGMEDRGLELIEQVVDEAIAALCAEAVGIQRTLLADTVAYAKQRRQFGRPIADFQVLQHRMADMLLYLEQSAAITAVATLKLGLAPFERGLAASAAKVAIGRACRFAGQSAVQIHGGIGLTDELAVSHYFKRATMIESELGTTSYYVRRYENLSRAFAVEE